LHESRPALIPGACGGWAETQAAYRFLAQPAVSGEDILSPHWQNTESRADPTRPPFATFLPSLGFLA
jgi:hypothetical protein